MRGRPAFAATDKQRQLVERLARSSATQEEIALSLGISVDTLCIRFENEIAAGRDQRRSISFLWKYAKRINKLADGFICKRIRVSYYSASPRKPEKKVRKAGSGLYLRKAPQARFSAPIQPTIISHTCEGCGKSFSSSHRKSRCCSNKCRQKVYSAESGKSGIDRTCDQCGDAFHTAYGDLRKRFCEPRCRNRFRAGRRKGKFDLGAHNRRLQATQKAKTRALASEKPFCLRCYVAIEPPNIRFCSIKCNRAHYNKGKSNYKKRAILHGVPYEYIIKKDVFDRDKWRCQICHVRTPEKLMGSHKNNAPELDHRIPMALGGGHVWENVQCACRRCNQEKGGTKIVGQLPLFDNPNSIGQVIGTLNELPAASPIAAPLADAI